MDYWVLCFFFFFQAEDGIRDRTVTGVQTCALPICRGKPPVAPWSRGMPSRDQTCQRQDGKRDRGHECPEPPSAVGRPQGVGRRTGPQWNDDSRLVQAGTENNSEVDDEEPQQDCCEIHVALLNRRSSSSSPSAQGGGISVAAVGLEPTTRGL